jgi:hypothetical protein
MSIRLIVLETVTTQATRWCSTVKAIDAAALDPLAIGKL